MTDKSEIELKPDFEAADIGKKAARVIIQIQNHLGDMKLCSPGKSHYDQSGPKAAQDGYEYAEVPAWKLRQWAEMIDALVNTRTPQPSAQSGVEDVVERAADVMFKSIAPLSKRGAISAAQALATAGLLVSTGEK